MNLADILQVTTEDWDLQLSAVTCNTVKRGYGLKRLDDYYTPVFIPRTYLYRFIYADDIGFFGYSKPLSSRRALRFSDPALLYMLLKNK